MRTFRLVLVNTFLANITTNMVWFGLIFWVYLGTRSVLVTSVLSGSYMLLIAVLSVPFGTLIDRVPKKSAMTVSASVTLVAFAVALIIFRLVPVAALLNLRGFLFWAFALVILTGAVAGSIRDLTLATCVSMLVPGEDRPRANGMVGVVHGVGFALNMVFSGLVIGFLGIGWLIGIGVALIAISLAHLASIRMDKPVIAQAENRVPRAGFFGAFRLARTVPGLLGLIGFSTLNNLLAGVYLGLLDPYGLQLVSVQAWGTMYCVLSMGFVVGGMLIQKTGLGRNPVRTILGVNMVIWPLGAIMTIRESVVLLAVGIVVFMGLVTYAEAAEQTVMQKVVPFHQQGRVFGFALAIERASVPVSTFIVGPVAEFVLIPYMVSDAGQATFGWLLGEGATRGIALVFLITSVGGLVLTLLAFASPPYRMLSRTFAASEVNDHAAQAPTGVDSDSEDTATVFGEKSGGVA